MQRNLIRADLSNVVLRSVHAGTKDRANYVLPRVKISFLLGVCSIRRIRPRARAKFNRLTKAGKRHSLKWKPNNGRWWLSL